MLKYLFNKKYKILYFNVYDDENKSNLLTERKCISYISSKNIQKVVNKEINRMKKVLPGCTFEFKKYEDIDII